MVETDGTALILGDGDGSAVAWIQAVCALVGGPGVAEKLEEGRLAGGEADGVDGAGVGEDAVDGAVEGGGGEVGGGEDVDNGCVVGVRGRGI